VFSVIYLDIDLQFLHCILLCTINLNVTVKLKTMYKVVCEILHILTIQWLI